MKKKAIVAYLVCFSICTLFADDSSDLLTGLDAYSRGEWNAAVQSFERALAAVPEDRSEALYWLVMAEASAQNYRRALYYADAFLENASEDERAAEVIYQKGRFLHLSGDYETSSKILYQFIEDYSNHPKLPSAYYWIGENFYAAGNYAEARKIFNKVVVNYPQSGKVGEARYKIVLIDQQSVRDELLRIASESKIAAVVTDDSSAIEKQSQDEDIINRLTALEEKLDELSAMLARISEEQEQQHIREWQQDFEQQRKTEQQQKEQEDAERQQLEKRRQELAELKERTRILEELYAQRMKGVK